MHNPNHPVIRLSHANGKRFFLIDFAVVIVVLHNILYFLIVLLFVAVVVPLRLREIVELSNRRVGRARGRKKNMT